MNLNVTTMICRLTKDVDLKYSNSSNNMAVAKFSVACDRDIKRENEPTADFYNCIAFGKTAEVIEKHLFKGSQVGLEGRFQNNNWTDKDGNKHYDFQFVVSKMTFCGAKKSEQQNKPQKNDDPFMGIPDVDDRLPFNA